MSETHRKIRNVKDITCYKQWINKLVIYSPSPDSKPLAAYISGVREKGFVRGRLQGQYLNSSIMFIGDPKFCIEYSPRLMNRMMFAFRYGEAKRELAVNKKRMISGMY